MSDRPIGLGKVAENGTLNENGAFYSVQDINVLLKEKGGGGVDLPTPTVADAGKAVVVDEGGKYALGEAGGDSDFSIANVTFINNSTETVGFNTVEIVGEEFNTEFVITQGQTLQRELLMYKGYGILQTLATYNVVFSGSGGAIYDAEDDYFEITGDGTITITNPTQ